MNLFKIQNDLIADRSADAWYRIRIAGPTFNYRWTYGWNGDGDFSNILGEHESHAVCREEPSLTMSWGLDSWTQPEPPTYPWADKFVGDVRPFWTDFFWNGALIDRVELCRVDGVHGVIPLPSYGLKVSDFEVAVASLIHGLEDGQNGDHPGRYLDMIGAVRVPDVEREGAGSSRA